MAAGKKILNAARAPTVASDNQDFSVPLTSPLMEAAYQRQRLDLFRSYRCKWHWHLVEAAFLLKPKHLGTLASTYWCWVTRVAFWRFKHFTSMWNNFRRKIRWVVRPNKEDSCLHHINWTKTKTHPTESKNWNISKWGWYSICLFIILFASSNFNGTNPSVYEKRK